VALVKVRTGRTEGDRVELLAGVTAADRIVTSGAGFLNDGDRVRVAAAAPASTAAPAASSPAAAR
jgi:hypothetical protein